MFRHCYVSRDQLPKDLSSNIDNPPAIAFTMLSEFELPLRDQDQIALELIGNSMATGHNLVHRRRTFPHRYDAITEAIIGTIANSFPNIDCLRVYDVAVSNGVSSKELFEELSQHFELSLLGMDYLDRIFVVGPIGPWKVVFDNVHRPLQFVSQRFVIPAHGRDPWRYPVNRLLRICLKTLLLPFAKHRLSQNAPGDPKIKEIDTFHPNAIALSRMDPRFNLEHGDMYVPADGTFELIRAMSVFSNLSKEQISRAVIALCSALVDGGLLVVGRNRGRHTKDIPTTVFQRRGPHLVAIQDIMGGAEQRDNLLSLDLGEPRKI